MPASPRSPSSSNRTAGRSSPSSFATTGSSLPKKSIRSQLEADAKNGKSHLLPAAAIVGKDSAVGILRALEGVEVHVPFPVSAAWAVRTQGQEAALRTSATIRPASRVGVLGANLASAYHTLRNEFGDQHWAETMEWVRLGLGRRVETVATLADPGGGAVALAVRYRPGIQVPAFGLSDGTLSYLALVATLRLVDGRSLLAVDEPDLHLHPNLVLRVAGLLETAARSGPVVVTTQSDHLLDGLQSPAASVRVLQLGREGATRCLSLDDEALAEWLTDYRGLGEIRAAGHLSSVLCDLDD